MPNINKRKILITGGAGFIGSNFICKSLDLGHQIINIDKLTYAGNLDNLGSYSQHPNYTFYKEDICNENSIEGVFCKEEPEVIVNMAAESHVDRSIDSPDDFIKTNVVGTQKLLDVSLKYFRNLEAKSRFRFIHLSTDEVFGELGQEGKFNELMAYCPNSPYAASKASSDLLVRSYFKTYGLPIVIANSSNNYGPRQYPEKLIPLTIMNALEKKPLPIYGNGQQVRDWLYVEDNVQALLKLISFGQVGESYCIGANSEMTNLSLVELICDHLDKIRPMKNSYRKLIKFVSDRPGHDYRYAIDASKISKETGWSPNIDFNEGILQTILWYIESFDSLSIDTEARKRVGLGH